MATNEWLQSFDDSIRQKSKAIHLKPWLVFFKPKLKKKLNIIILNVFKGDRIVKFQLMNNP